MSESDLNDDDYYNDPDDCGYNGPETLIPTSPPDLEKLIQRLNEHLDLELQVIAAKAAQKDILEVMTEDLAEIFYGTKKSDIKRHIKMLIDEHFKKKASQTIKIAEAVKDDYQAIRGKLRQ